MPCRGYPCAGGRTHTHTMHNVQALAGDIELMLLWLDMIYLSEHWECGFFFLGAGCVGHVVSTGISGGGGSRLSWAWLISGNYWFRGYGFCKYMIGCCI